MASPEFDLLAKLIESVPGSTTFRQFLERAVGIYRDLPTAERDVLILRGLKGTWRAEASAGKSEPGPVPDLLADVLDSGQPRVAGGWQAMPLSLDELPGHVVTARGGNDLQNQTAADRSSPLAAFVDALQRAAPLALQSVSERQRALRLAAMLEMTAQWNQTRETAELLARMAETSTRLLDAERATIFLLDASGERLIGRPALGMESDELSIPAGAGVVGQVVADGQPRRVDEDIASEQAEIDRSVDAQSGFRTRSLLCVPMFNAAGETIGAFELLNKQTGNFSENDLAALEELAAHAATAIENTRHIENLDDSRRNVADEAAARVRLIGQSEPIEALRKTVARVAETELAVLILGENGTGKEVVAQLVHYHSPRRNHVMVAVNCAAITETLLESELFGHERGAFTDAHETRRGKFELASGGTLLLDEIGDMSPGGQAKLLRVLEEKVVVRVGGSQPIPVDTRVVAATNQDLGQLVREKKFREDLFFRLNVVSLQLPPLRERGEDILLLADHFLADFAAKARRPVPKLSGSARKALLAHSWPGNVRELRNMMERLAYLSSDQRVDAGDLTFILAPGRSDDAIALDQSLTDATRQFQADFIDRHIKAARGNMTDAAERLGLHRSNLYRKMKQLGMDDLGELG